MKKKKGLITQVPFPKLPHKYYNTFFKIVKSFPSFALYIKGKMSSKTGIIISYLISYLIIYLYSLGDEI